MLRHIDKQTMLEGDREVRYPFAFFLIFSF